MAKKKISRKELLKSPDEFITLSVRAIDFFQAHRREIAFLLSGLVVISLVSLFVYWYVNHENRLGQKAYASGYDIVSENMDYGSTDPHSLEKAYKAFDDVIENYGISKVAVLSLPQLGYISFQQKKYDDALKYYLAFHGKAGKEFDRNRVVSLNTISIAYCYEIEGKLNEAEKELLPLKEDIEDPFRSDAMLSLERLYRLNGQKEKAMTVLKEYVDAFPSSPFYAEARARLLAYQAEDKK